MPNDREFWNWFWPAEEMYSSAAEMNTEPSIRKFLEEQQSDDQDHHFIQRPMNKTNPN